MHVYPHGDGDVYPHGDGDDAEVAGGSMGRSKGEPRVFEFDANTNRQQTYYLMITMVVRMIMMTRYWQG